MAIASFCDMEMWCWCFDSDFSLLIDRRNACSQSTPASKKAKVRGSTQRAYLHVCTLCCASRAPPLRRSMVWMKQ